MAYITLTPPHTAPHISAQILAEISSLTARNLHAHARPAAIHILGSLPKTSVGKINKIALNHTPPKKA